MVINENNNDAIVYLKLRAKWTAINREQKRKEKTNE
jgi:hypothetical protein